MFDFEERRRRTKLALGFNPEEITELLRVIAGILNQAIPLPHIRSALEKRDELPSDVVEALEHAKRSCERMAKLSKALQRLELRPEGLAQIVEQINLSYTSIKNEEIILKAAGMG